MNYLKIASLWLIALLAAFAIIAIVYYWPVIDRYYNMCDHYPKLAIDCKQ